MAKFKYDQIQFARTLASCQTIAAEVREKLGFVPDFKWGVVLSSNIAGQAHWRWKDRSHSEIVDCQINLSPIVFPLLSKTAQRETVIHEICHLLAPRDGHGHYWGHYMIRMGLVPERCWSGKDFSEQALDAISSARKVGL